MLSRLENRLGLLAGGARDLPERQQTLRGAIAWSHDMLDEPEQALFAGLSVFVGGAGLEAIEQVCGSEVAGDVLDVLGSLVEKSLVRQSEGIGGEPRFGMLGTIREFALEQSAARGGRDDLRRRHAELFATLAEGWAGAGDGGRQGRDAGPNRAGSRQPARRHRVGNRDRRGRRGACGWDRRCGGSGRCADTCRRGSSDSSRRWRCRRATTIPQLRADALDATAGVAYWLGDGDHARDLYEQEIEARRALNDRRGLAEALYGISFTWSIRGLLEDDERRSRPGIRQRGPRHLPGDRRRCRCRAL